MKELPHTHSCFVCGESNPIGLKLRFETDGRTVQTRFRPKPEHAGFQGVVHGGLIVTVLDEIMVWACAVQTGQFAFCAEFTVRFLASLRPNEEALVTAELVTNRKGKIFEAKSALSDASGKILAEGTGKYLPIKANDISTMLADVVGDTAWVFGKPLADRAQT